MLSKACIALALAPAAAFNFGDILKKKSAPKPAAPAAPQKSSSGGAYPSVALPFTTTNLDGSLKIFREAELMHGRIAQLACLGWVFPEIAHFPGKDGAFGKMNPFEAVDAIPNAGWYQILAFMASLEVYRVNKLKAVSYTHLTLPTIPLV